MRPWQRREAEGSDTIADVTETRNLYQADVKPFTLLVKYQARWSLRCTTTRVKKFVYWGRNAREAITKKSAKNCCSCSLRPHQWWVTIQKNMYWKSSVLHVQALQFSSFTNKLQERNHLAPPHDITSLTSPLHSTPHASSLQVLPLLSHNPGSWSFLSPSQISVGKIHLLLR